jgi:hypothetical protein
MPLLRRVTQPSLFAIWALVLGFFPSCCGLAAPPPHTAALIQTRGTPPQGGQLLGGGQVPLERAEGGDTPVLTFRTEQGPVRLLLDTGAALTMVTGAVVDRLGLAKRPLPPEAFSMAGGGGDCPTLPLSSTRLPILRLMAQGKDRPLRIQGVEALVIPGAALPPGVDGVMGASLLKQQPVVVDPVGATVVLGAPVQVWRRSMGREPHVVALAWRHGVPVMPLRGRSRTGEWLSQLLALADTGAEGLFLTEALAAKLIPLQASQPARLVGVCGEQMVRRQKVLGLGLGPVDPLGQSVEAIILSNSVFERLGVEAIVGQELLRTRRQLWRLDVIPPRLELW